MSKYKILIVLFFFVQANLNAQVIDTAYIDNKIDSVYKVANDSTFAFSIIINAMKQSKEIGYKNGEVAAMQLLGYLYIDYGNLDSAKKYLLESHELAKKLPIKKQ
ncbi:MAG: hypothetical protein ACEQSR_09265 [Candidatus Methylacidiphilales bacterium]